MNGPGFESYNMVNMDFPMGMGGMNPNYITPYMNPYNNYNMGSNMNTCPNSNNQYQTLENEINNLKLRMNRLENSFYPEAIDYSKTTYQSQMNMM